MNRVSKERVATIGLPRSVVYGAVVAMAIAVGLIVWLATRSSGGSSQPAPPAVETPVPAIPPVALTAETLAKVVDNLGQPVYWVGRRAGYRYELQRLPNGNVIVRYLPADVQAGSKRALASIGTYPFKNALVAELRLAARKGWRSVKLRGGWVAVYRQARPTNIYLARSGFDYQVEVFDPSAARARQLVDSGVQQIR